MGTLSKIPVKRTRQLVLALVIAVGTVILASFCLSYAKAHNLFNMSEDGKTETSSAPGGVAGTLSLSGPTAVVGTLSLGESTTAAKNDNHTTSDDTEEASYTNSQPSAPTSPQPSQSNRNTQAASCYQTPIPYKTTYIDDPSMDEGKQEAYGGVNGYKNICPSSPNLNYTNKPIDKRVYVGTRQKPTSPSTPSSSGYTRAQAQEMATRNCNAQLAQYNASNSSAMAQCVAAYMRQYGY